jgi:hypothetical protein
MVALSARCPTASPSRVDNEYLLRPDVAVNLGVNEPEDVVDQSMYLFERYARGIMDILLTWLPPASAEMMPLGYAHWPVFALIGAGVYLYFHGVFSITRIVLQHNGLAIGGRVSGITAYVFGALWALSALVMIGLATAELGVLK